MGFLSKYKTDKDAETNGVWVEVDNGVELKVARINNDKAREERRRLEKPYRNFANGAPEHVQEDILRKVVSKHVLLDWKGVTDDDGKPLTFSAETAEKLFKEFPDFLNDVLNLSMARETFAAEATEAVKNA